MANNNGFFARGVNAKGPSSLDALMATLFTAGGVAGYNAVKNLKSILGEYPVPIIVTLGVGLGIGIAGYIAARYIAATDTPSNNGDQDTILRDYLKPPVRDEDTPLYKL